MIYINTKAKKTKKETIDELIEKGKETRFKTGEDAAKKGRNGGVKSGEVRRENAQRRRDARAAARYILGLKGSETSRSNLHALGAVDEDGLTNMEIYMGRLWSMSIGGNLEAGRMFMEYAGYDPKENRAERESVNADRRREVDTQFKMDTMAARSIDAANVAVNFNDEDGNPGVVIYLPELDKIEEDDDDEDEEEIGETPEQE